MAYVAIVGAAGYTGRETLARVLEHPELDLVALGSDSLAGKPAAALDPRLARDGAAEAPELVPNGAALASGADLVFLCLDHAAAAAVAPPGTGVVVDLSGGHRLRDPRAYASWYGFAHPRPDELADWCYALPELRPPTGRLVASPGCYATAVLLALGPLVGALDPDDVVVDAKSGISGAGAVPTPASHAAHVLENVTPYRVGSHQHAPEIEQALGFPVTLVPHVLPVKRGIVATCYVRAEADDARARLEAAYEASPVVEVLAEGVVPELTRVQGTDAAEIAVFSDRTTARVIVICALDNLGKGGAGQALQSANLALGLRETDGLRLSWVLV